MRLVNVLRFFKVRSVTSDPKENAHSVEDVLASVVQRLDAADPDTNSQWQRLERALSATGEIEPAIKQSPSRMFARPAFAFAVAACIVAVLGVVWLFRPSVRTYSTAKGEQMTLTLEDSSQVILNHTSQLAVTYAPLGKTRIVSLTGEAYFNVRHNGEPFIVRTEVGTVRVLGTEFDVRDRDNRLEVGVVRGSVQVTCTRNNRDSSVTLAANQIVACTKTGFELRPTTIPFPDYPGWVHGRLLYYRTDLASVCKELEARYDVRIEIREERLRTTTITGSIDNQNIESALATLSQLTGSKYHREGNTYTLY